MFIVLFDSTEDYVPMYVCVFIIVTTDKPLVKNSSV